MHKSRCPQRCQPGYAPGPPAQKPGSSGGSQLIQVPGICGAGAPQCGESTSARPPGIHLQLLVQVTNIHAGQGCTPPRGAAGTLHAAHLDAVLTTPRAARSSRRNQVGHWTVVDVCAETLECPDGCASESPAATPLGDAVRGAETCTRAVRGSSPRAGSAGSDLRVMTRACLGGFLVIDQAGTVPREVRDASRKTINLTPGAPARHAPAHAP